MGHSETTQESIWDFTNNWHADFQSLQFAAPQKMVVAREKKTMEKCQKCQKEKSKWKNALEILDECNQWRLVLNTRVKTCVSVSVPELPPVSPSSQPLHSESQTTQRHLRHATPWPHLQSVHNHFHLIQYSDSDPSIIGAASVRLKPTAERATPSDPDPTCTNETASQSSHCGGRSVANQFLVRHFFGKGRPEADGERRLGGDEDVVEAVGGGAHHLGGRAGQEGGVEDGKRKIHRAQIGRGSFCSQNWHFWKTGKLGLDPRPTAHRVSGPASGFRRVSPVCGSSSVPSGSRPGSTRRGGSGCTARGWPPPRRPPRTSGWAHRGVGQGMGALPNKSPGGSWDSSL